MFIDKLKQKYTFVANTGYLYILQASKYLFPILTYPYLTRVLEPHNYGLMTYSNAFMLYFSLLVDYGFLQSATRDVSLNRDDADKVSEIFGSVMASKFILWCAGLIILIPLIVFVPQLSECAVYILLSYTFPLANILLPDFLFRGIEKMGIITTRTVVSRAISTALTFIVIHKPDDYIFIPLLNLGGTIFAIILTWRHLKHKIKIAPHFKGFPYYLDAIKKSTLFFTSSFASTVYGASNAFILRFTTESANLAMFTSSSNLINTARNVYSPMADSVYPYMVAKKNFKVIKLLFFIVMPATALVCILLFIYAKPFILIASGPDYLDSIPLFRAQLPILFVSFPVFMLGFPTMGAMDLMKQCNLSTVYAAAFHFLGFILLFLTNQFTMINVCYLTCLSQTMILLLRIFWIFKKKYEEKMK